MCVHEMNHVVQCSSSCQMVHTDAPCFKHRTVGSTASDPMIRTISSVTEQLRYSSLSTIHHLTAQVKFLCNFFLYIYSRRILFNDCVCLGRSSLIFGYFVRHFWCNNNNFERNRNPFGARWTVLIKQQKEEVIAKLKHKKFAQRLTVIGYIISLVFWFCYVTFANESKQIKTIKF